MSSPAGSGPVAIVGMAALFPGARGLGAYWRNIRDGVDAITEVPAGRWDSSFYDPGPARPPRADRVYCRRGGFVDDLAEVEATRFGIMPSAVPGIEPDQLIALQVAADAIADAGGQRRLPDDRSRVGVILGRGGYLTSGLARLDQRVRTAAQLVRTLGELIDDVDPTVLDRIRAAFTGQLGACEAESAINLVPNLTASRIANRLNLHGPAYTTDAACASSLVAVDAAVAELARGRCDVVLAGGVHHCHDITLWSVFSQLGALSPSQRIRPLDRAADGILIGEGTGVLVLTRLADAVAAGDRIYAVIRGTGIASDGRTASLMNPDPAGQVRAVRQAWRTAELDPRAPAAIGLLEAHGTATHAGDSAELVTLTEVFGPLPPGEPPTVVGSVKSMIGHAMPAAGIAGLIKSALAVYHATLPPTLHCEDPHEGLGRTRFAPLGTARPWDGPVRRAGVNAFGFGGINAHVLIDQAPGESRSTARSTGGRLPRSPSAVTEPERVLRLAADSPARIAELLDVDDAALLRAAEHPAVPAADSGPVRLGVVAPSTKRLAVARKAVARQQPWRGRGNVWFTTAALLGPGGGSLAFVCPGLEAEFAPRVADVSEHFGLRDLPSTSPLGNVRQHGAAVLRLGRLLYSALERMSISPDAIAGHSIGEWTAIACAGYVPVSEVDKLLDSLDSEALELPDVAFAMLGAPAHQVGEELDGHPEVMLSHDNAPNQCVICGAPQPVRDLVDRYRRRGVIAQVLPFRSGFHTPLLAPYLDSLEEAVGRPTLHPPRVPLWSATTASRYPDDEHEVRALLIRHLLTPVRFRPLIEAMYAAGVTAFVQLGVGQLGSLISDTLRGKEHLVVAASSARHNGLAQLGRVATALWVEGRGVEGRGVDGRGTGGSGGSAAGRGSSVRLDLGAGLVSLPAADRPAVTGSNGAPTRAPTAPAPSEPPALPTSSPRTAPGEFTGVLRVSTDTMPYLRDHCFFAQRPDWPDEDDRYPVVPATTLIAQLAAVAERVAPGTTAVAVREVTLSRWLAASPPVDVGVSATPLGDGALAMSVGEYATATVDVADAYPRQAPPVWSFDPGEEAVPELSAAELYRRRWMFHGPAFQGVTELTAIGPAHVRGVLTSPPAPGGLLDNVGQLLGYWIMATHRQRTVVFPVGIRQIRFFGPHPPLGTRLTCSTRITELRDTTLEADMQLVRDGQVWAEITGWVDRRFDNDPVTFPVERAPDRNTLARRQPGGWELVFERWPDLASRELILRGQTCQAERCEYDRCSPPARRHWVLGRIAVKDAVRRRLWDHGTGPVFPAEIRVGNDAAGRPTVSGTHGRVLPELSVSLAHSAEAAVALVRDPGHAVGIDIETVCDRAEPVRLVALGVAERELLEQVCGHSGEPRKVWFTRFWAAKEAVAKAEGTGLAHRPPAFAVRQAERDELLVTGQHGTYRVHVRQLSNPPELPDRDYVVAWTVRARQGKENREHE